MNASHPKKAFLLGTFMFVVLVAGCAMFQVSLVCFENVDGTMAIGYPNNVFFLSRCLKS